MAKYKMTGAKYCLNREIPVAAFFCDEDNDGDVAYAKSICSRCYAREECLDVALKNWEEHGIFGGLTASERKKLQLQEALRQHSSPPNKSHEPSRQSNASPFFPLHTSFEDIRTQRVSQIDFAKRLACRVAGLEVSKLLSLELSTSPSDRTLQFVILLDQLRSSQLPSDHNFEYDLSDRRLSCLSTHQKTESSAPLFQFQGSFQPNQYSHQGQSRESSSAHSNRFCSSESKPDVSPIAVKNQTSRWSHWNFSRRVK